MANKVYRVDTAAARLCRSGVMGWFKSNDLDWSRFLAEGLDEEVVLAIGGDMAERAVSMARARRERRVTAVDFLNGGMPPAAIDRWCRQNGYHAKRLTLHGLPVGVLERAPEPVKRAYAERWALEDRVKMEDVIRALGGAMDAKKWLEAHNVDPDEVKRSGLERQWVSEISTAASVAVVAARDKRVERGRT